MWKKRRKALFSDRIWVFCDGSTGMIEASKRYAQRRGSNDVDLSHLRKIFAAQAKCAAAAIARTDNGDILDWAWQTLQPMSNNEAEYAGLLLGLEMASRLKSNEVICVLDSAVVIGQMEGRFAVNSQRLRGWHWRACEVARTLPIVRYCLVPREWNRLADGLATQSSIPWPALRAGLEAQSGRLAKEKRDT